MSLVRTTAWGLLLALGWAGCSLAAMPIDRPSPPPYCADGRCYPKVGTWGHYEGRWRSWPGVDTRPGPLEPEPTPADKLGPDLKPYEPPAPQDEDMRAPPPTPSQEQEMEEDLGVQPEGAGPPSGPPGSAAPPSGPPGPGGAPGGPAESDAAPPRVPMPIPSGRAPPGGFGEEDADFPPPVPFNSSPAPGPGLPFGSPTPDALPGNVPGDLPIPPDRAEIRRGRSASVTNDDPPPPLPAALGGLASM